ncbi:hypothetical protein SAMN05216215_1018114 [Saccharopolyspora shandongensis]|uniref:Uncharacterized protein n=1 Tax=Saccharopolyspora shandongensis TaxID=418495 RepID=A0A1H3GD50_9PSEU|nr:hypothetical protein [Saccharopolyspora shandongensis]SDY00588.1 hypothetical protein SAMN05216215_1018114 [Saccharopolyspora shandongensis]
MDSVRIGLGPFLDYVRSTPRGCVAIVKSQRRMYLDPDGQGSSFYGPLSAGLRRAVNSTDPEQVIAEVVKRSRPEQRRHYEELQSGFGRWWSKTKASGVPVASTEWVRAELAVRVLGSREPGSGVLGLRYRDGKTEVVLPYLKEPELGRDAANLTLRILELHMNELLPGAIPVVLDLRRAAPLRLRSNTNRDDLDAVLAGEAAKYVTHWQAAAA